MQHSKGARAVAAAALTLGLTLTLSACSASDVAANAGKSQVAAKNKVTGYVVREDEVQQATADWQQWQRKVQQDSRAVKPAEVARVLAFEPLYADASQTLGMPISRDDARKALEDELASRRKNRPHIDAPPISEGMIRIQRLLMMGQALERMAPPTTADGKAKLEKVKADFTRQSGANAWEFSPRYGLTADYDQQGVYRGYRPWLGVYRPYNDPNLFQGPSGPNGRPMDQVRSPEGDSAPSQGEVDQQSGADPQGGAEQPGGAPAPQPAP